MVSLSDKKKIFASMFLLVAFISGYYLLKPSKRLGALGDKPISFPNARVSNDKDYIYISIANQTPEAKLFLEKYKNALISANRTGDLMIEHWSEEMIESYNAIKMSGVVPVDYSANINIDDIAFYLRLRVFVDSQAKNVSKMFLECFAEGENAKEYGLIKDFGSEKYIQRSLINDDCFRVPTIKESKAMKEGKVSEDYLSIGNYKYKMIGDVSGPIGALVNRSKNITNKLKVGDEIIFYAGTASKVWESPAVETLSIGWMDINVGEVVEIENATIKVKYTQPGIFFEKMNEDTFQAVPKFEGEIVSIPVEKALHIVDEGKVYG